MGKIFEAYWALGLPGASIPTPWPPNYSTPFNVETPLELKLNGTDAAVYFSVGPRTHWDKFLGDLVILLWQGGGTG